MTTRLRLLGGFEMRLDDQPAVGLPTKARALLAYLAIRPGQSHPRDKLAALLWGDAGDAQARDSLRHAVGSLRRACGESTLLASGQAVALNPASIAVDVVEFEQCIARGTPEALERAATLYRGDLLEGGSVAEPPFEEWLLGERERLREAAIDALAKLVAHLSKEDHLDRAIQCATRLLGLDPLREAVHRMLMRLCVRRGRRGAALTQYQVCVNVLRRELDTEPESETKELYQEILRRRPEPERLDLEAARPSLRPEPGPFTDTFSRNTPLIGREPEQARLISALEDVERGRGRVVTMVGEAGLGKSRLLAELASAAIERGSRVLLGRSYESEQILAFGPWIHAVRSAGLIFDDELLRSLDPVWRAELGRLLPELRVPGLPAASEEALRLFESVAELIRCIAANRPLVVMLEDLHWADEMSARLVAFLARRIARTPVLLVVTAREEELEGVPVLRRVLGEIAGELPVVAVRLAPLAEGDTRLLVRTLSRAGSDDATIARLGTQVWAASEGNPFVVMEAMRAFNEGNVPDTSATLALPERVRQLITGRIERLGESGRQLLAVAAVVGREFEFDLVQRAAELEPRSAAEGVEELVRRRLFYGVGERLDFVHDRVREVAYRNILPPLRKTLHGMVARALEALHAENLEPHYGELAMHYRDAGIWDRAVTYLKAAGVQAAVRSAYREAVSCFDQALAALTHLPDDRTRRAEAVDLRLELRNPLTALGDFGRVLDVLREARTLAETVGDQRRLGQVFAYLANLMSQMGDYASAVESGQRALAIAETLESLDARVGANVCLGTIHFYRGDYRQGAELCRENIESLRSQALGARFGLSGAAGVFFEGYRALSLAELGRFPEAMAAAEDGIRIAEALAHPYSQVIAAACTGYVHVRRGNPQAAIPHLEDGLTLCQTRDIRPLFRIVASTLGHAYVGSGRAPEAIVLLEQALDAAVAMRIMIDRSLILGWLGQAHGAAGRMEDAIRFAREALAVARSQGERGHEAWALRLLGEIAASRDHPDVETADTHYRDATSLARELGMRPLEAQCHLAFGMLFHHAGHRDRARSELGSAIAGFREMTMRSFAERAEAALARLDA